MNLLIHMLVAYIGIGVTTWVISMLLYRPTSMVHALKMGKWYGLLWPVMWLNWRQLHGLMK